MEDSDSGVTSMSSGHGTSVGGDDRSGAGSRSSAASLALSEVSSPAPPPPSSSGHLYYGQQQLPLALTVPRASSTEPVRVWRDPQLLESGPVVRHIHSMQHSALMMAPGGGLYEEDKSSRDRAKGTGGGVRDMERGKDVDRERMVHHIQRERERDADREAEQAVDKHFAESLKKYNQSQTPWSINTIPVPHGMIATGASPPRSTALGAGISPSLSISSIPPTTTIHSSSSGGNMGLGSLNISPSPASNSANKKGFVKASGGGGVAGGNLSKGSDSVVVGGGGHVIDHHANRGAPDVIGMSAVARNGHYDHYLPPPSASQILAAEEQRRVRERIIMADRGELDGDQLRMQHHHHHQQQQQAQQQREREKEMDRIRHLEQQRASYYGANVHRSPTSASAGPPGSTNGKSTSSISVIPTSSPASAMHSSNGGNPTSVSIDYAHHRGLTISPSMKHVDKQPQPQQQPQQQQAPPVGHPMFAYHQHLYQPMAYHKDAKGKQEMALPAPPPLLSDVKASGGVIVKHDGSGPIKSQQMPSSLQVIPTSSMGSNSSSSSNKSLSSPNHYKNSPSPAQSQLMFEYRNATAGGGPPNIVSIHATSRDSSPHSHHQQQQQHPQQQSQMIYTDRYKMQSTYPSQQAAAAAQQRHSPATASGYQRQAPSPKQIPPPPPAGYSQVPQNKPRVSSPAPAHIYGKPDSGPTPNAAPGGAAGIMSGIPVCRANANYIIPMHSVSKTTATLVDNSRAATYVPPPPPHASSQRNYGASGPPPAHSRVFEAPSAAWAYAAASSSSSSSAPPHSSLMQSAPPVSISVNSSPASSLNRRSPVQVSSHPNSGHSISISASSVPLAHVPDVQTQPLDLGISDRSRDSMHSNHSSESKSPPAPHGAALKRKSNTPINYHHMPGGHPSSGVAASAINDMKKKRFEFIPQPQLQQQQQPHHHHQQQQQPQPPSQYQSPHPSQYPLHPSYSVYQGVPPGSVAIHAIPGPQHQPYHHHPHPQQQQQPHNSLGPRKEAPPPVSVVVSVAGGESEHQKPTPMAVDNVRENFQGQPMTAIVTPHSGVSNSITITPRSEEPQRQQQQQQQSAITITTSTLPVPLNNNNNNNSQKPIVSSANSSSSAVVSVTTTPVKLPIAEPSKSVSPVPKFSHSGPRNLKKAWLQRHSGEDSEEKVTSPVESAVTQVAMQVAVKPTNGLNNGNGLKESLPIKSLSSVGSMAVNSVAGLDALPGSNGNKLLPPKKTVAAMLNTDGKAKVAVDSDSDAKEESSSSDQEHAIKTPPKKKQAKTKRKKGGGRKPMAKKKRGTTAATTAAATTTPTAVASESDKNSDSDKESGSEKDSDSGTSTSHGKGHARGGGAAAANNGNAEKRSPAKNADGNERRKRGRRPKVPPKDVPLKKKQSKPGQGSAASVAAAVTAVVRGRAKSPTVAKTFLQEKACHEMVEKLPKCRECRLPTDQRMKAFCRFYAFRRLRFTKHNQLAVSGFSDPKKTPSLSDRRLWEANRTNPPTDLDLTTARFILSKIALQLCNMLSSEMSVWNEHRGGRRAWKKVVNGMREMCDVCETTLFNLHWSCNKCGLAVCLDCCRSRREGCAKSWSESEKDCDEYRWLLCTNGSVHDPNKLTSTQIMTGNTMGQMDKELHHLCNLFGIRLQCQCATASQVPHELMEMALRTVYFAERNGMRGRKVVDARVECDSPLSVLADVALQQNSRKGKGPDKQHTFDHEMLKVCQAALRKYPSCQKSAAVIKKEPRDEDGEEDDDDDDEENYKVLPAKVKTETLPVRVMNVAESKQLYPDTPHSWLCDGKLLRLHEPMNPNNYPLFQEQWCRGQPVLVSDVTKKLTRDLWTPDSFAADFGEKKHDVVNCINGDVISMPMKKFWDGFDAAKRLKDDKGQTMLLKLKDWPPDENFATMLPDRFEDLMAALPLPDYTHRNGRLNLAGRLPSCFVRPDLGPKMYNAYGSALHPAKGTTNLHMDISDAVNVMVYVGIPKGAVHAEETKEAFRAIDEAGCDILTRRRVRDKGEMPGALWHIYAPEDADKIRKLLREVAKERGEDIEPDSDPIHDQNWYLDGPLRERLYKSYGVEGYPIAQCLGDAIFIPAGAPHQVRNLHNCIKVAEDFVSPENISNCFQLTHEFRQLSDSHQNHEDKLQIKNIIYHAAKDVLAYLYGRLKRAEEWGVATEEEFSSWKRTYEGWMVPKKEETGAAAAAAGWN